MMQPHKLKYKYVSEAMCMIEEWIPLVCTARSAPTEGSNVKDISKGD